jgi:SAM-dependent methyltransferase
VQTLDPQTSAPDGALRSPAASRNAAPILDVLRAHLPAHGRVLEIAAGSGQHALAFSAALPGLDWTPSDPSPDARASIAAWRAVEGAPNLAEPLALDCLNPTTWPEGRFKALVCINMVHISPWAATEGLMAMARRVLAPMGLLYLYGPYREAGVETAPSNEAFDADLKTRDPAWGLRDVADVAALAKSHGLALTLRKTMPANNLSLLFRRVP